MMQTLSKLLILNRRRRSARDLGFNFQRAASFDLPREIRLDSRVLPLNLPADEGSRTAFVDVLLDDCYRLRMFPREFKKVLDIGAHAGLFSLAARQRFPDAVIHSYEPNPQMHSHLSRHATDGRFTFYREAVGLVEGKMSLESGEDSVQTRARRSEAGEIHCASFSNAIARLGAPVDLVKMDCEGAEWEILKDDATWRKVKNITMEFHLWAGYTLDELKTVVTRLGFKIRYCKLAGKDFGLLLASRDY